MKGQFTGRHMAATMIAFFGVVIAVNLVMARYATSTFGGVVVENSYVASQHYNRWLDEAAAENALGWRARASRTADGRVAIALAGVPKGAVALSGDARHPLGRMPDQTLQFAPDGKGGYVSRGVLPAGRWRLRIEVRAGGHKWRTEQDLM